MNGEWYNQSPEQQRIDARYSELQRMYEEYMVLIHKCSTDAEKMAKTITELTEDTAKHERRANKWRERRNRAVKKVHALHETIEIQQKELRALKSKSLLSIIKDRFNKWFF